MKNHRLAAGGTPLMLNGGWLVAYRDSSFSTIWRKMGVTVIEIAMKNIGVGPKSWCSAQ